MPDATRTEGRRQLLKAVTVGGGAVVVGASLPAAWTKPVIESVVLPAHAQASGGAALTDEDFSTAVALWFSDEGAATATYGHISNWDVSAVTDMSAAFENKSSFNEDLSSWDVSRVTNMQDMFGGAESFNGDISSWDVSSVTNMNGVFYYCDDFDGDIGSWDVSNVTDMSWMFNECDLFNADISSWDVSSVTDMSYMFRAAKAFNGDISSWDVSSVTDMSYMFRNAEAFNQDLNGWCVTHITIEPTRFDAGANAWEDDAEASTRPEWGTCP